MKQYLSGQSWALGKETAGAAENDQRENWGKESRRHPLPEASGFVFHDNKSSRAVPNTNRAKSLLTLGKQTS